MFKNWVKWQLKFVIHSNFLFNINKNFFLQKGFDVTQQKEIDDFMLQEDGTDSKSKSFDEVNQT